MNSNSPVRNERNRNIDYELSPKRRDEQTTEAMWVLDQHVNLISKQCYFFIKGEVVARNASVLQMLRDYSDHEDSQKLVDLCNRIHNAGDKSAQPQTPSPKKEQVRDSRASSMLSGYFPKDSPSRLINPQKVEMNRQKDVRTNVSGDFQELRQNLGIRDGYNFEEISDYFLRQMEIHGQLTAVTFKQMFIKTFPETAKVITATKDGKSKVEETISSLFHLMDEDKDGLIDQNEMASGLRKMFPTKREYRQSKFQPGEIFDKIDFNDQGTLFLGDVQQFVLAQLNQIARLHSQQRHSIPMEEMAQNIALFVFLKADTFRDG